MKSAFQEGLINEIDEMHKDKANVRVGWGTRMAELQGPIGLNAYGYGYRDIGGEKVIKVIGKVMVNHMVLGMLLAC